MRYRFHFPSFRVEWSALRRNAMWFGFGALFATAFAVAATVTVIDQALDGIQVSSKWPGPLWVRFDKVMYLDQECWNMTDEELTKDRVQQEWGSLRLFLGKQIAKFGVTPLNATDRAYCGLPPVVAVSYKVASGTAVTRPLYDGAAFTATPSVWKQIGTVAVGTKCEDAVIRKTTVEYHYTTNASNLRGLAACVSSLRF